MATTIQTWGGRWMHVSRAKAQAQPVSPLTETIRRRTTSIGSYVRDLIKRTCFTSSESPTNHALVRSVNMKYTVQVCLFTNTTDTSGMPACDTACNPVQTVLETSWFTTPMATQYNYCDIDSGSFPANADTCASCLRGKPGSVVLGNCEYNYNRAKS